MEQMERNEFNSFKKNFFQIVYDVTTELPLECRFNRKIILDKVLEKIDVLELENSARHIYSNNFVSKLNSMPLNSLKKWIDLTMLTGNAKRKDIDLKTNTLHLKLLPHFPEGSKLPETGVLIERRQEKNQKEAKENAKIPAKQ